MKQLFTLAAVIIAASSIAACTTTTKSAADLPAGEYEKSTTKTTSNGTTYKTKTSTDVGYDENGNKKFLTGKFQHSSLARPIALEC